MAWLPLPPLGAALGAAHFTSGGGSLIGSVEGVDGFGVLGNQGFEVIVSPLDWRPDTLRLQADSQPGQHRGVTEVGVQPGHTPQQANDEARTFHVGQRIAHHP